MVDDFSRECVRLIADTSISGARVGRELDAPARASPAPDIPLYPDIGFMAERRRRLLCRADQVPPETRRLLPGRRPPGRHNRFIREHTETEAKPFTRRADHDQIIAAGNRGFQMSEEIHQGELASIIAVM